MNINKIFLVRVTESNTVCKTSTNDYYYSSLEKARSRLEIEKISRFDRHSKVIWNLNPFMGDDYWVGRCECCTRTDQAIYCRIIPITVDKDEI